VFNCLKKACSWNRALLERLRYVINHDPLKPSLFEVLFTYSGLHALGTHRISHYLYQRGWFFLARLLAHLTRIFTGIEIHPGAKIGKNCFIDHGVGIVIGETADIGDFVTIYHGVTLGGLGSSTDKRHPTIGDYVLLSAGSILLGDVSVGQHAKIGAGAVVIQDVPPYATVVGVPAKIVRYKGERIPDSSIGRDGIVLRQVKKLTEEFEVLKQDVKRIEHLLKNEKR
jgi:serine O-acetyltransferase